MRVILPLAVLALLAACSEKDSAFNSTPGPVLADASTSAVAEQESDAAH